MIVFAFWCARVLLLIAVGGVSHSSPTQGTRIVNTSELVTGSSFMTKSSFVPYIQPPQLKLVGHRQYD